MKEFDYNNVTIAAVDNLMKTGYISTIICDGDNKKIYLIEEEVAALGKMIGESIKSIEEAYINIFKKLKNIVQPAFNDLIESLNKIFNKKLSKKKFIKLLRSQGIHQIEINKIVKGNKEKYTYLRYYTIINDLKNNENNNNSYISKK